jgi:polyhydroxyalkanoate synthesis regulator phasin
VDKTLVSDAETAANTLIDANAKRKPAVPDELNELERRRKILEEKARIQELEQKLSKIDDAP